MTRHTDSKVGVNTMRTINRLRYYGVKFASYHVATYAASASFFIITAVFPLLMLTLSIVSLTPLSTGDMLEMISLVLPKSFDPLMRSMAADMTTTSATALSLSALATVWTAGKSMLGLMDGLNAIQDVNDTRNILLKRAMCVVYMLILIAGLLLNLALRVFGQHIQALLQRNVPGIAGAFSAALALKGLTLFLVMTLVFMLIYTAFPSKKLKFLLQAPGAAFTSLAWLMFSSLFSVYVNRVGQISVIYGGLTTMILAMLWLYFCMYIVFIGAVINKVCPELFWRAVVIGKRWWAKHEGSMEPVWASRRREQRS